MTTLACFVSPHGFGHAARLCAVLQALDRAVTGLRVVVYSLVPKWFFQQSLEIPFTYREVLTDVGLVQRSPLHEDPEATARALRATLPFDDELVGGLASEVRRRRCSGVLCDISPLGVAVAARAGLPSVVVENFTWDWVYRSYAAVCPELAGWAGYLEEVFAAATARIQASPVCRRLAGTPLVAPVSRSPRRTPSEVRRRLGVPSDGLMAVLSMGGVPWTFPHPERLAAGRAWVVAPGVETGPGSGRLIGVGRRSDLSHPDLVQASDLVVGKLGYSTLAEAYGAGRAMAYVSRPTFPESAALERFADREMAASRLSVEELESGDWVHRVAELARGSRCGPRPGGGDDAARIVRDVLGRPR